MDWSQIGEFKRQERRQAPEGHWTEGMGARVVRATDDATRRFIEHLNNVGYVWREVRLLNIYGLNSLRKGNLLGSKPTYVGEGLQLNLEPLVACCELFVFPDGDWWFIRSGATGDEHSDRYFQLEFCRWEGKLFPPSPHLPRPVPIADSEEEFMSFSSGLLRRMAAVLNEHNLPFPTSD